MEIFDFNVAPSKVFQVHYAGSYVYYASGSAGGADATISLRHDASGDRVLLLPGQGFRLPDGAQAQSWRISNYAGTAAILGRLVIGAGAIDDNRITGSVEVIDGGRARTMAGTAFGSVLSAAVVAGSYTIVALRNPAGSGKNVIVKAYRASQDLAGYQIAWVDTGGATGTLVGYLKSKKAGGAVSAAEFRWGSSAAAPWPASANDRQDQYGCAAGQTASVVLQEPLVLPQGYALNFVPVVKDCALSVAIEWNEENAT